ncbi:TonB-dependent receptor [uncultured Microbulbifer sp.]|uniref:TonB-dependent receptor n=1 Tax=uncultured Microbulbifer sp. TaxID=348147 RepID=UPI00260C44EB|nr:TonB-dependent receptor [uncultured Microbulbifer sp.]
MTLSNQPLMARKNLLALTIGAAVLTVSGGSIAAPEIEEVTVTAQMRAESLKDVPMSVSAFSGDTIKNSNLSDFKDLFALTPGISGETTDSYFDSVSVRGVNNNSFGSGSDPALGIFLDGVYQSRTGATPSMFDLDRVEIVKGPQGTLFGRNTASGAISMTTRKPGEVFAGDISVNAGQYGRLDFEGAVDMPVSEDFAVRIAGIHQEEDGHVKNLAGGRNLGASETDAMRITAVYDGFEDTTVTLLAQYEDRVNDGTIYRALDTDAGYDEVYNDHQGTDQSQIGDAVLTVERQFSSVTFSSITGYKTHDYTYVEDFDGTAMPIDTFVRDQTGNFLSQEFRLTSDNAGPFNWVLGASYYQEELDAYFAGVDAEDYICAGAMEVDYELDVDSSMTCAELALAYPEEMDDAFWTGGDPWEYAPTAGMAIPGGVKIGDGFSVEESFTSGDYTGWGVFANTTFDLTEATSLGFGVRYTEDRKQYTVDSPWPDTWTGGWNYQAMFTDGPITGDQTWSNVSGRATLNHDFSESITAYASVATGYKSGGFDYLTYRVTDPAFAEDEDTWLEDYEWTVDSTTGEPNQFDEEQVLSYELGLKARLLDNRLHVNAAAFQYTYEDLQQAFFIGAAAVTRNVGESEGQGLEVDARWLITDNLDVYMGLAWLDTAFTGAPEELCEACDGNQMAFSPEFSSATVLTYNTDIGFGSLALSGEYTFTGEQFADLDNTEEVKLDSRGVVNLRASITSPAENWTAGVYVENLTGEEYYHWGYAAADYNLPATQTDPSRGRVAGVNLDYRF